MKPSLYTPVHLVELFIELENMMSDEGISFSAKLKENTSKYYRYLQTESLCGAYQIANWEKEFSNGKFIRKREKEDTYQEYYRLYKNKIKKAVEKEYPDAFDPSRSDFTALGSLFSDFYSFKKDVKSVIDYNKGILAISGLYLYGPMITQPILNNFKKEMKPVDDILSFLISPQQKTFEREVLVKAYNFPDVDLWSIDCDNF